MKKRGSMAISFGVLLLIFTGSASAQRKKMNDLAIGIWAGRHISMEVSKEGARFEFDCANGQIRGKIALDKNKAFKADGIYIQERGGPVSVNETGNSFPAVFSGSVAGKKLTLAIRDRKSNKLIGKFILYHGKEPDLTKCR